MNEQLKLLIRLQELDSKIISHSNTIKSIPLKISQMDIPINKAEEDFNHAKSRYEAMEKKKRDKELAVEENKDKITKAKTRTADIKDNKAYHAHLKEIENIEKSSFNIEDEILSLMEEMEKLSNQLKSAEDALAEQKQKAAEYRKKLDAEVITATQELEKMKAERGQYVEPIDSDSYKLYMTILKEFGAGIAVSSVDSEICGGCDMNIMPQLYMEIKKGDSIIQCPQCKRILYYIAPVQDAS